MNYNDLIDAQAQKSASAKIRAFVKKSAEPITDEDRASAVNLLCWWTVREHDFSYRVQGIHGQELHTSSALISISPDNDYAWAYNGLYLLGSMIKVPKRSPVDEVMSRLDHSYREYGWSIPEHGLFKSRHYRMLTFWHAIAQEKFRITMGIPEDEKI